MNQETVIRNLTEAVNKLSRLMEKQLHQRNEAVRRWRDANPKLARRCQHGALKFSEALNEVLDEVLSPMEADDESLNAFTFGEFIDKFGPRLTHLNNMVQMLSQLGG